MERDEIVGLIRATPDLIANICRGLSDEQLRRRPAESEWSLLELACHLRDSAIEEGMRARRMVEEDNPALDSYDQLQRAIERNYSGADIDSVMTALRAYWTGYAYQLERFSEAEWERPGFHPQDGPVSVCIRAELEMKHTEAHVAQMQATRQAVTPKPEVEG